MHNEQESISIWFFIGILLAFYGLVIAGYGVLAWNAPVTGGRVLGELHADVWWGALLLVIGLAYTKKFFPSKLF